MPDVKISALTELNETPASNDLFEIVDVSDTTMAATGTNKKITRQNLIGGLATSGVNANITQLTGLTTPLSVAQGGTGATTLTGILKGNGTSAFTTISEPAGSLVGTTATQTLTNKTIDGDDNTIQDLGDSVFKTGSDMPLEGIVYVIDGGGSAITTGVKGDLEIPFNCVIQRVTILADTTGSIVVDIWKNTYASYPPTSANSITASAKPTITSSNKGQDTTLTGWTTSIAAGETLRFHVDSASTITRVTIILQVRKV